MSKLLDEIENCLLSDVSSDAMRVWMWLRIVQNGRCPLSRLYDMWPNLIRTAIAELQERNLIRIKVSVVESCTFPGHKRGEIYGRAIRKKRLVHTATPEPFTVTSEPTKPTPIPVSETVELPSPTVPKVTKPKVVEPPRPSRAKLAGLTGRERAKAAFDNPKLAGAKEAIDQAMRWAFRRYNEARLRQGVNGYGDKQFTRNRKHWRALASFVTTEGIEMDRYLDFVYERTRWQKVAFPTPSVIGGSWAQQEWAEKGGDKVAPGGHAGARYIKASEDLITVADEIAKRHGHELNKETLEYIVEQADCLIKHPRHYTPDPELSVVERELAEQLKEKTK